VFAVGRVSELQLLLQPREERLDLRGCTIFPGFIDNHIHLAHASLRHDGLDLRSARSAEECVKMVGRQRLTHGAAPIYGFGWNDERWTDSAPPTRRLLDKVASMPAVLVREDGHAAWFNSAAWKKLSAAEKKFVTSAAEQLGLPANDIALAFEDSLRPLVAMVKSDGDPRKRIAGTIQSLITQGVTSVAEMDLDVEGWKLLEGIDSISPRVFAFGSSRPGDRAILDLPRGGKRVAMIGLKAYLDGALGSRGAALFEKYSDGFGNGALTCEPDALMKTGEEAAASGLGVAAHAIGDRAVSVALDVFEQLRAAHPDLLLRIEHAQCVRPIDFSRFARSRIVASMQFVHFADDAAWAPSRLGEARMRSAYAWRSFVEAGALIAAGSDAPIASSNPMDGILAAGGGGAARALTREEALLAYTRWGAEALGMKGAIGTIEPGAHADLVAWDTDLLSCTAEELAAAKPRQVWVAAK
jgi:hypothetical protein